MSKSVLTAEEERHIAAVVAAAGRRAGGAPFRLEFHSRRIEIRAIAGADPRNDRRTVRAAGATAFDICAVVRGLGHEASARLAPRPSEPLLLATVTVGRKVPPSVAENILHMQLAEEVGSAPVGATNGESWWGHYEHLIAAADDEGARLKRFGHDTARRVGLTVDSRDTPVVLTTWGDGPAAWMRAGMAAEKVRLVAAGRGLAVELPSEDVQEAALRERIGDVPPDLGWSQVVLVVSRPEHADAADPPAQDRRRPAHEPDGVNRP